MKKKTEPIVTLALYFDKDKNRYIQLKLELNLEDNTLTELSRKTLTSNRNLAIMGTSTIDMVRLFQKQLE